MVKINASGMSCPQPVLMAKKALSESADGIEIIVDSPVAVQNVSRYAKNAGYKIEVKDADGDFCLSIKK